MANFELESMYQDYLRLVGLDENKMPKDQRRETKRAWYGAAGQFIFKLRDEVAMLSEDEGVKALQSMTDQIAKFWNSQNDKQN